MKNQLLLLALLFACFHLFAQDRFAEGYIVNSSGDTVRGRIMEDMNSHLAEKVLFKANGSDEAKPFTVQDIRAFGFDGNIFRALRYFDKVDSAQKEGFGKLLVEGHYNLYTLYFGVAEHYFDVRSADGKDFFLFDDVMGHTGATRTGNFRNELYFIGQSCPNALNRVEAMGFSEKEVAKFVQQANRCLEPGQASATHFKKAKTEVAGVYLFAGGMPVENGESELLGQLLVRLVSPSLSRKASINVGLSYSRYGRSSETASTLSTVTDRTTSEIYSIPFQLQYNFLLGRFQPYFYTGFAGIYKVDREVVKDAGIGSNSTWVNSKGQLGLSVPIGIGVEIYPTSRLIIKADLRYELLLHYPVVGVAYKF